MSPLFEVALEVNAPCDAPTPEEAIRKIAEENNIPSELHKHMEARLIEARCGNCHWWKTLDAGSEKGQCHHRETPGEDCDWDHHCIFWQRTVV